MPENKTKPTKIEVEDFIRQADPKKIEDSLKLVGIMEKLSGEKAKMWGPSIIGFGSYHYKYASGHEGDMCAIGFSPRKAEFSLYVINSDSEKQTEMIKDLGKIKMGKACIYFKKLDDLNLNVLENLIRESLKSTKEKWG
ncbi:MAG: DUF1801 domain-containing protein [Kaistella sp.]|nr:DUF1801 domain-containing protein [Kaistella sp.]